MSIDKKLVEEVQALVDEVKKTHRYSMSRIYGLSNRVFDRDEKPQSCASCLIRKVRELGAWLDALNAEKVSKSKRREKKLSKKK